MNLKKPIKIELTILLVEDERKAIRALLPKSVENNYVDKMITTWARQSVEAKLECLVSDYKAYLQSLKDEGGPND